MRGRIPSLRRQESGFCNLISVVGQEHAPSRGRYDLVAIERENRKLTKRSALSTFIPCPQRLCRIFQNRNIICIAYFYNRIELCTLPIKINNYNCFRQAPTSFVLFERPLQCLGAHVPTNFVRINENGRRALVQDRVGARCESQSGTEDGITSPHTQQSKSKVNGRSAGINRSGMADTDQTCQLTLEGIDMGPQRGDPVRSEGLGNEILLCLSHMWR